MEYLTLEYLPYIDWFTVELMMLVFILILMIAMVFWFGKGFSYFLNEVLDLKNNDKNKYDTYKN